MVLFQAVVSLFFKLCGISIFRLECDLWKLRDELTWEFSREKFPIDWNWIYHRWMEMSTFSSLIKFHREVLNRTQFTITDLPQIGQWVGRNWDKSWNVVDKFSFISTKNFFFHHFASNLMLNLSCWRDEYTNTHKMSNDVTPPWSWREWLMSNKVNIKTIFSYISWHEKWLKFMAITQRLSKQWTTNNEWQKCGVRRKSSSNVTRESLHPPAHLSPR